MQDILNNLADRGHNTSYKEESHGGGHAIFIDRNGYEFARVNLTYNNPDPTELGECTGNYQKIKDLILAARSR